MASPGGPRYYAPVLLASDFEATVAFYRDQVGLPMTGQAPFASCETAGARIAILDAKLWNQASDVDAPVLPGSATTPHTVIAVEVPNVEAAFERMMASGVRFLSIPTPGGPLGRRHVYLRDPDGRLVALMAPPPSG